MSQRLMYYDGKRPQAQVANLVVNTDTGKVGIGTTNPGQKLQVGDGSETVNIQVSNPGGSIFVGQSGSVRFGFAGGAAHIHQAVSLPYAIGTQTSDELVFGTNNLEHMRIDASGNVGIGNPAPTDTLVIGSPANVIVDTINHQIIFSNNITIRQDDVTPLSADNQISIGRRAGEGGSRRGIYIGYSSGRNSVIGSDGIGIGYQAAFQGQQNACIAIGREAGRSLQEARSVAIGEDAGTLRQGTLSIAIGYAAGSNIQGSSSIAIGEEAGNSDQKDYSIAIGYEAGELGQNAHSIGIGYQAGQSGQYSHAVSIGYQAGEQGQQNHAIAVGFTAGQTNQGSNAVAVGRNAAQTGQKTWAIAVGTNAGNTNQGENAIAVGLNTGQAGQNNYAIAFGGEAGQLGQYTYAIAVGYRAGNSGQEQDSIAVGRNAGQTNQGSNSIAIGRQAGRTNQPANTIVINAIGADLNPTTTDGLFIKPISQAQNTSNVLTYDATSGEITETNGVVWDASNQSLDINGTANVSEITINTSINTTSLSSSTIVFDNQYKSYRASNISSTGIISFLDIGNFVDGCQIVFELKASGGTLDIGHPLVVSGSNLTSIKTNYTSNILLSDGEFALMTTFIRNSNAFVSCSTFS